MSRRRRTREQVVASHRARRSTRSPFSLPSTGSVAAGLCRASASPATAYVRARLCERPSGTGPGVERTLIILSSVYVCVTTPSAISTSFTADLYDERHR